MTKARSGGKTSPQRRLPGDKVPDHLFAERQREFSAVGLMINLSAEESLATAKAPHRTARGQEAAGAS